MSQPARRSADGGRAESATAARPPAAGPDLATARSAWLVGIEGVGMSGAAELLLGRGLRVGGVDRTPGERSRALTVLGAQVHAEDAAPSPPEHVDLVVHSAAIPEGHPALLAARARGLRTWRYAELLGALMADRNAICVAGCHGKTTTSSLLASALLHAEADPSFVVGGNVRDAGSGARSGAGPHFVAESCEFDRSFHAHRPRIAIVTNIDEDHLDYYRDLAEIQESFRVFAGLLPEDGALVVNDAYAAVFEDDPRIRAPLSTYGLGADAAWRVSDVQLVEGRDCTRFALAHHGQDLGTFEVPMVGQHNVLNATAAIAAMVIGGIDLEAIRAGISAFGGVGRRLERVAEVGGVLVLDDYGHHPAEIRCVVRALRKRHENRRLVVIFQPHQASRTRCLLKEFAAALAEADEVWMPPIYFARDSEEERRRVTSEDLAAHVRNEGGTAVTCPDLEALVAHGVSHLRSGDVVVTMGAGNIDEVAHGLAARLL